MTPDPRRLSEAALAAIGEQAEQATPGPWYVNLNNFIGGWSIGTVPGKASENPNYGDIADFLTKENALQIVGLAERLAEALRELAADPGEEFNPADNYQREIADLTAQLARAHADHAATVAELRMAIEKALEHMFDLDVSEDTSNDGPAVVTYSYLGINTLKAALAATPSIGAAAVLAAADEWFGARQNLDENEEHTREQAESLLDNYLACKEHLEEAVAAWRAARGDQGGTT